MEIEGMIGGAKAPQEGRKLWQILAAVSAGMLAFAAGTVLAWTSPVLPTLQKPDSWLPITEDQGSWVGSLMAVAAIAGALPAGKLADKFGRKKIMYVSAGLYIVSWLLLIFSKSVGMLYAGRIVAGTGVGCSTVLVPMYVAEVSELSIRGTLGIMFQLLLTSGILFAFIVGVQVSYLWFAIVCALVIAVFLITFVWMPESPQWLLGQGRKTEASKALALLRGDAYDLSEELADMQREVEESESKDSSIKDLFKTRGTRIALLASMGVMAFQQLSGINAVIFYTSTIFRAAGSSLPEDVSSIIVALVQVVMCIVSAFLVDRAGRKMLLLGSSSVMTLCLFLLGLYFKLQMSNIGWLPLVSLTVFMIAFSVGFGPIPWMLVSEMFPAETKGAASGLAVMTNWLMVFVVTKTFPDLRTAFGEAITFWLFAGLMVIATLFTVFVVPETKGKTPQQVQAELNGERNSSEA